MTDERYVKLIGALPYGKEFLLIDKVIFLDTEQLLVKTGYYYLTGSPLVRAHFGGRYIAGCLLTEQVCQNALLLLTALSGYDSSTDIFLTKVTSDYFRPVRPGDMVLAEVILLRQEAPAFVFRGTLYQNNERSAVIQAAAYIAR